MVKIDCEVLSKHYRSPWPPSMNVKVFVSVRLEDRALFI